MHSPICRLDHSPDTSKTKKNKKMGGLFHKKVKDEDRSKKEEKKEEPASGKKRWVSEEANSSMHLGGDFPYHAYHQMWRNLNDLWRSFNNQFKILQWNLWCIFSYANMLPC